MQILAATRRTLETPLGAVAVALGAIGIVALPATRLDPLPGGVLVLLATGLGAWVVMRRTIGVYPEQPSVTELPDLLEREVSTRQHARWFCHMRRVAIVVSFGLILFIAPVSRFLPSEAFAILLGWWIVLVVANIFFVRWVESSADFERQIVVQGVVDLVILTGFLNASGGIENPVYFAYLFHVIIGGILLPPRRALLLTAAAALLFVTMTVGEYSHLLPHFTNELFPHEVAAAGQGHHEEGVQHASHGGIFVAGRVIPFLGLLFLSTYLTSIIAERLRARESQLESAGEALMLEHQRLERVVDAAGVGMMLVTPDLNVLWATRRASSWARLSIPMPRPCPLYAGENGCELCVVELALERGGSQETEREVRTDRGGRSYFRHAASPVRDAEGRTIQVVELLEDVTDRKLLEAEAMHAGKLSALGQMAAGVAHEIGNPLSSISTRLTLLERKPEREYVLESVSLLKRQIERIRRIVHGISVFARSRRQDWSVWDLNEVVNETIEVIRLDRRASRVLVQTDLAQPSPRVRGAKDQMTQVLLNLLLNATEASPEGGEVVVQTEERGARALLRVRDNGSGIAPEDQDRLFEPFFSTKSHGTGLGLAVCFSLVNAHGGSIEVDSRSGAGSTFTVVLPADKDPTGQARSEAP